MSPVFKAVALAAFLAVGLCQDAAAQVKILRPRATWWATLGSAELRKQAPSSGVVADSATWARLWKSWRGREPLPAVDFTKDMILVATAPGPNRMSLQAITDGEGDVRIVPGGVGMAGRGFGYAMIEVSRSGLRTVNGAPIDDKSASDYIKVEVKGQLQAPILDGGAEATAATLAAKGIAWELDFGDNADLAAEAAKMYGKTVIAKGTLERQPGADATQRWIIKVREIAAGD